MEKKNYYIKNQALEELRLIGSETAWSCTSSSTCNSPGGSGGGYSKFFTRPTYQNGLQTNSYRGTPDLSANAFPSSGYYVCFAAIQGCYLYGGRIV